jgi:short-subunit dehydrogenase
MSKKLSDIDVSVLVNNVGVGIPVDRDASATFREIAANCYPVVLLTQEMISRF